MAKKETPQSLFRRLTKLFKSGPLIKKKLRTLDTTIAVPDKTKSSGVLLFQKSLAPTYATITANAYNLSERLMRYQDFQEMEYTPEIAAALDIYCLAGNSIISTPYGDHTIKELFELNGVMTKLSDGCDNIPAGHFPIYCYDSDEKCITIGLAHSVRKTGSQVNVIKVTLDNGQSIRCTPNHRFMLRDGSYVAACDLTPATSLMPFNVKMMGRKGHEYPYVYTMNKASTKSGWRAQHLFNVERLVGQIKEDEIVHHVDFDRCNNKISNLKIMKAFDHSSLHAKIKTSWSDVVSSLGGTRPNKTGRPIGSYTSSITYQDICNAMKSGVYSTQKQLASKLGVCSSVVLTRLKSQGFETFSDWQQSYHNHKVVSVELDGVDDVYDITTNVHHNFACNGVIVHNSDETVSADEKGRCLHVYSDNEKLKEVLDDLFYNTLNVEFNMRSWVRNLPVKYDTPIPLLDNRNITIEQLAREYAEGKENWVYSVQDGTHRIVPGKVVWCGLTRKDSELVRISLDNGTHVDCTPDHEFILRDGTREQAQYLCENQSLMPFYRQISSRAVGHRMDGYEEIYDPRTNRYVYTHRRVAEVLEEGTLKEGRWLVTHHKDFNKRNNDPNNLVRMDEKEHMKLHQEIAIANLHSPEITTKRMAGIDRWLRSDDHHQLAREQLKKLQERGLMRVSWSEYNASSKHAEDNAIRSAAMKKLWSDPAKKKEKSEGLEIAFDAGCVDIVVDRLRALGKYVSPKVLGDQLKADEVFMGHFKEINGGTKRALTKPLNSHTGFENLLRKVGISSYIDLVIDRLPEIASTPWFKRAAKKSERMSGVVPKMRESHPSTNKNHKVIKVERLQETSDVYCMEVLGPNGEHDRHNFALLGIDEKGNSSINSGICVGNCKYGDFFLYNDVSPDFGVVNAFPIPVNEVEREENYDRDDPFAVRYRWVTLGNRILENWEVTHFRLLGNDMFLPYGSSIIEPARRIWRQLILIEDAMLVYRVVRAPERRVFYIDVANVPPDAVPLYVEEQKRNLRTNQVIDRTTGRVDLRYNPLSVDEDYFIPVRGADTGTRIDTLQGGQNAAAVEDVAYIQKKLFAALKIPRAYLGYDELLCLSGDTQIPLLSGVSVSIHDLAQLDWSKGDKDVWAYSADQKTGTIVPGRVINAWKTKDVTELYEVKTDDGGTIRCTGNHPFLCSDGTYKRADELTPGQSLMPLYKKLSSKSDGDFQNGYEKVLDNSTGKWNFTHRLVNESGLVVDHESRLGERSYVVHHVDHNKRNNNPSNLVKMGKRAHIHHHMSSGDNLLSAASRDKLREVMKTDRYVDKHRTGVQNAWDRDDGSRSRLVAQNNSKHKRKDIDLVLARSIASTCENRKQFYEEIGLTYTGFQRTCLRQGVHHAEWLTSVFGNKRLGVKRNHKVLSARLVKLDQPVPVYDIEVEGYHNFSICTQSSDSTGKEFILVHNSSKATLAQEDIRFSRTISVIQKTMIAELNKIAIIHLYAHGFDADELQNFTLRLSNPSTVAQQQKLELWRAKFEIAGSAPEGFASKNFIRKEIWGLNDEECRSIDEERLKEKIIDGTIEGTSAAGGGEEGGDAGGGDGAGGADLFGGGGGEAGGETGGEEEATPPPETAGDEPEEDVEPGIELLTSSDDSDDDENFGLKLKVGNLEAPVNVQKQLDRVLYNRGRIRTHGASKTHMPDFQKMTSDDNHAMEDPYDMDWMKSVVSNPFGEAVGNSRPKLNLSADITSALRKMSLSAKFLKHQTAINVITDGVDVQSEIDSLPSEAADQQFVLLEDVVPRPENDVLIIDDDDIIDDDEDDNDE